MAALTATVLSIAGLGLGIAGQVQQSRAQARAASANRRYAEMAAEDAEQRGEQEIVAYQRQLRQVTGQQRVGLAAQNIDLTQGTAAQISEQTRRIGEQDIATIRRNIEREAWGIRTTGDINYRTGMAQSQASMFGAAGTLITAAGDGWRMYQQGRGGPAAQPNIPTGQTVMRNPLAPLPGNA